MKRKEVILYVFLVVAATLFLSPLAQGPAQAETFRLTIGAGHPPVVVHVARMAHFFVPEVKKRVEARTQHKIEWVEAWAGSVAKLGHEFEAIQGGLLDAGLVSVPFEPLKLFLHNYCYFTPFASTDVSQVAAVSLKVFEQVPFLRTVFEEKYNQKFLGGLAMAGSYHLITKFPWKKIEDLKGKKIAAAGPNLSYVKAAGAVPVQSDFNEAYTSLKTGVYEGWVIFANGVAGFKLYEVARHFTYTNFGAIVGGVITMNLNRWKRLPKEVQDILIEVGREYTMDEAKAAAAEGDAAIQVMQKAGVEFYALPFEEMVRWANMMPDVPNNMAKEANTKGMPGTQVFKAYITELEKAGFKFPRRWEIK
ncbi:MAG: C4-dicarboxylate TRAP transporter substrate-binding protein [Thermodesulfobacteriota bacterium]